MIATLLDKQERQPDTALTDSQDAAQEYFPEDFFGQQGACYDPQQGFELDSNVAADFSHDACQGDFDNLPCGDMYQTTEASGPEVFASLADRAIKAVTLPMKKEVYSTIADKYAPPANTAAVTAPESILICGQQFRLPPNLKTRRFSNYRNMSLRACCHICVFLRT